MMLSKKFTTNVIDIWGIQGQRWLEELPLTIAMLSKHWQLIDLKICEHLSYHFVATAFSNVSQQPVVIKIGYDHDAIFQEQKALNFYAGHGCVRIFDYYEPLNALLLERLDPGTTLASLFPVHDQTAVLHAVNVMKQLHAVPLNSATAQFPTIADWLAGLEKEFPQAPAYLQLHLPKARTLAQQLLQTQASPVVLHGDLHHENILLHHDTWTAIDPKGVIGEPAYEVGAFIRNPIPSLLKQENMREILAQRLDLFAQELIMDRQCLKEWSYVQEVLADCWSLEDGKNPEELFDLASVIEAA